MRNLILSPCGTSILTNIAKELNLPIGLVYKSANIKDAKLIDSDEKKILEEIIEEANKRIFEIKIDEAKKISAELNGIISFYNNNLTAKEDYHILLSTDTWLGVETANIVAKYLESKGLVAEVLTPKDLNTSDLESFHISLCELVNSLEERLNRFKDTNYKVIFNLTGGFKGVLGFLQSISNFYADETIYIFESSSELMRIPKLPVKIDESAISENIDDLRRLKFTGEITSSAVNGIPSALLMKIDNFYSLSPWGDLLWNRTKRKFYSEKLLNSPSEKIIYSNKFRESVKNLPPDRMFYVNETIDDLMRTIVEKKTLDSSKIKKLRANAKAPSTHEIYAWSDKDAKRIFFHYEDDKIILDILDKGLH